jgi:hypothetical protein
MFGVRRANTARRRDKVYMGRGSDKLHTVWIPWANTPVELGGLVILEGSASLPGFERMRDTYGEHDVDSTPIKNRFESLLLFSDFCRCRT